MHVLHVCQPTEAGVPRVVRNLAAHQTSRGVRVSVACPPDGSLAPALPDLGVEWVAWSATRQPGPRVPAETRALGRLLSQVRPDLVHLHSAKAGLAGRLAVRGRLPTVFQPHAWSFYAAHGLQRTLALRWEVIAARWTDVLVAVSEGEQVDGERAGVAANYRVIPNGVPLPDAGLSRDEARRSLDLPDGPLVVCIGRLCEQKGQDRLLDAWASIVQELPDARLHLVGDGPDQEVLEARASRLPGVHLPGGTTDVTAWLCAADVVALPSRWEAGLSLVAMEAMAAGRSVVATDVSGVREGLLPSAGAVVPQEDQRGLIDALVARLRDPGLSEQEGQVGQERVRSTYDVSATNGLMDQVYAEVLGRRPG